MSISLITLASSHAARPCPLHAAFARPHTARSAARARLPLPCPLLSLPPLIMQPTFHPLNYVSLRERTVRPFFVRCYSTPSEPDPPGQEPQSFFAPQIDGNRVVSDVTGTITAVGTARYDAQGRIGVAEADAKGRVGVANADATKAKNEKVVGYTGKHVVKEGQQRSDRHQNTQETKRLEILTKQNCFFAVCIAVVAAFAIIYSQTRKDKKTTIQRSKWDELLSNRSEKKNS